MITRPDPASTASLPATLSGAVCAAAGEGQRDLQECADIYGGAFAKKPFDPALFSTVALANGFCAPWLGADQLKMANRASLWAFGVDWAIDYVATTRAEVDEVVSRCMAVVHGEPPADDDPLLRFLADIRDELAAAPTFADLGPIWRAEFKLMLDAMAREWTWQAARAAGDEAALPDFEAYLANADNICFSFVFVSHWIVNSVPSLSKVEEIRAAGREVQVVIRLLNDLGTYHRDLSWGDLNPLMLGVTEEQVSQRVADLTERCERLLEPLCQTHPDLAVFLSRYIQFNAGFYRIGDYWGNL